MSDRSASNMDLGVPEYIWYHVAKNVSSPKLYRKLVQCSKYFYNKNPILLLHCLLYDNGTWRTCSKIGGKSCGEINGETCSDLKAIDLDEISIKIWVTNVIGAYSLWEDKITPLVIPSTLNSYAVNFEGWDQELSFDQLLLFGGTVKSCYFENVSVKKNDHNEVSFAEIVQSLPMVEEFTFDAESDSSFTSTTVKELLKIPHFYKIKTLKLGNVSDEFDIEEFYQLFLKANKTMEIGIWFNWDVSDIYKQKIEEITKEILESESNDFFPPVLYGIYADGMKLYEKAAKYKSLH
uniref:Uncharacterized protein n=1 Tax=Panagrolaimus davidi TaxID=227884 RepID=A0A914QY78_9BILA